MKKFTHTDEARFRMSIQRKGELNSFFGKSHTDETKLKISQKNKKGRAYYINKFKSIHGDKYDYSLVEDDITSVDKVDIICSKHGIFSQKVYSHYGGYGCKYCRDDLKRRDVDELIEFWKDLHEYKYDYSMVEYKNNSTKVKIVCPEHGEFSQRPSDHSNGLGCPVCKQSKGEREIRKFLKKNNISFEPQKRFDECYNKLRLPFDFYLTEYNILIEYDGEQHFEPKYFWGGEKAFLKIKENEEIKNKFAIDNNITLIRINYKEKNKIKQILEGLIENNKGG